MFGQSSDLDTSGRQGQYNKTDLTRVLADANGFDLDALEDNRQGVFAPQQKTLLLSGFISSLLFILVPGGFLFFQLSSQGYLVKFSPSIPMLIDLFKQMPKGLLIIGGITFFVVLLGIYFFLMTLLDYFGKSVKMIEGVGEKKISTTTDDDGSTTTRLYYVISGKKFSVKKRAYLAFEYGRNYRAYYTPRRKVLVNIEAIN